MEYATQRLPANRHDGKRRRPKWGGRWRACSAIVVTACLTLAACGAGGAEGHEERRYVHVRGQPYAFWAGKIGPTVAKLTLPGGGRITFLVVECRRREPSCHQVGHYTESPAQHEPGRAEPERTIQEGPRVDRPEPIEHEGLNKVLDWRVEYSCVGQYPVALVDALLRQPKDIVTDRSAKRAIRLSKAQITVRFHPEGVLVYGLLLPSASRVVVTAPDGRTVDSFSVAGASERPQFKGPSRPAHCAAE